MPLSDFQIGITSSMTNIESLATPLPVPRAPFRPYARVTTTASGLTVGKGFASCQWVFSMLTAAQRTQLRTFCAGASAAVYIRTMTNEADGYASYQAIMHWPEDERRDPSKRHDRLELAVTFTHLVAVV
jgi:hypothetical protein